jgi:uncharacterized Ntn-hydrolase superfamily protein
MTFSIVAYDPDSESWGVAVASKCLAVGHAVPWGAAGAGAVATQALANLSYGRDALALMGEGASADETVPQLVADDPLAAQRQVGVVDAQGRAASYTGPGCLDWKGNIVDGEVTVQGNLLAGPQVIESMLAAYRAAGDEPFVNRLLQAVEAGEAAGGDRRGRQSAGLRVWRKGAAYGGSLDMAVDLRVDDNPEPVAELRRLVDLHDLYFCRPAPGTLLELNDDLRGEITDALTALGYAPDELGGFVPAFDRWVGTENYEERNVPGSIDPRVLDALRRQAAGVAG